MGTMIVIGGGAAGMAAAVHAREIGVENVILLERNSALGGNGAQAGMIFAGDSQLQQRTGSAIEPVELYRSVRKQLNNTGDGKLIHDYVFNTGRVVDWLEAKGLDLAARKGPGGVIIVSSTENQSGGIRLGKLYVAKMKSELETLGVEVHTGVKATRLEIQADQKVCVYVEDGTVFRGDSIILATGGLAGSADALRKYFPEYFDTDTIPCANSLPFCDGSGIEMATALGARTGYGMGMFLKGPAYIGSQHLQKLLSSPKALWVDKTGRRFIDEMESRSASEAMNQLPSRVLYAIYDQSTLDAVAEETKNAPGMGIPVPGTLAEHLEKAISNGRVLRAKSIQALASAMHADPAVLEYTVTRYNHMCDVGEDGDFAKDAENLLPVVQGPFYAILGERFSDSSQGGISVDATLRIVDKSGHALGNIFAVGDHVSGWCSQHYAPPGGGFTWAMNSGYMAAEYAANIRTP